MKNCFTTAASFGGGFFKPGASGGGGGGAASPDPITLPSGNQHFWGLVKASGYSGQCLRVRRSSDSTEQDIGWNANQMLDTSALLSFVGAGDGFVTKLYDQVSSGAVDMIQATAANQPYIVRSGVVVQDASGMPCLDRNFGDRWLAAVNAFPGSQEFSVTALGVNRVEYLLAADTAKQAPIMGIASNTNDKRFALLFGARATNQGALGAMTELDCDATDTINELSRYIYATSDETTCLMTATCLAADLTGGPTQGSTLYFNRGFCETVNRTPHDPTEINVTSDIRLFAAYRSGWKTENTANGDCGIMLVAVGTPLTDAARQAFEGAIYDKYAAVISASIATSLPTLGSTGEAFLFSDYASDAVNGKKGQTNLQFTTAAQGATWQLSSPKGTGLTGIETNGSTSWANNFRASSNWGYTYQTFTLVAIVTAPTTVGIETPDIFGFGTGSLNTTNASSDPAWVIDRNHQSFTCWTQDLNTVWEIFGNPTGQLLPGLNYPKVPDKDYYVPDDHPYWYSQKTLLQKGHTTDKADFQYVPQTTYMILLKHRPHSSYLSNPDFYKYRADVVLKAAPLGCLNGFGKFPGSIADIPDRSSTAVPTSAMSFCSDAGHQLQPFIGWRHLVAFYGNKYTTDQEDQKIFYNGINVTNLL